MEVQVDEFAMFHKPGFPILSLLKEVDRSSVKTLEAGRAFVLGAS